MSILSTPTKVHVQPKEVFQVLGRHMLLEAYNIVMDLEKSHGPYVYDSAKEREILDLFTSFSTCPLGYNHPKLTTPEFRQRILNAALNKPSNPDLYTTELAEFVETLARIVPEPLRHHLFFIEGGALAVENGLKTAFDWKVRKNLAAGKGEKGHQIIHFREAFHGRSGYTLSLTNTADRRKTQYFPKLPWPRVTNPKLRFPLTDEVLAATAEAERRAVEEIEQAVADNPDDIAGLLIEPIQGEGGDNHFRAEFLQRLRRLADEHEFLLIFDEIQTGFATTGRWWCCEHFDLLPDILVFGKKSQVCGIAVSRRIDDVDSVFKVHSRISSTWGGNLVDMIRCQRYIEIIEEEGLLENAARVGDYLLEQLRELGKTFPDKVSNVRGRGMFVAFDLPDTEIRDRALKAMLGRDVLGLPSGHRGIRFRPPVALQEEDVDEGIRRIVPALQSVA